MYMVSEIFDLKGRFISKVLRKKKKLSNFYIDLFDYLYFFLNTSIKFL